jgi:hypothetical protein
MDGEPETLTDLESDLRAMTEDIVADAERLAALEKEKGRLPLGDPRLQELGEEAERLSKRIATTTRVESALVAEAQEPPEPSA